MLLSQQMQGLCITQLKSTFNKVYSIYELRYISDKQTKLFKGNWKRTLKDFKKAKEGNEKAILSMQSRRGWLRAIRREFSNIFKLKNEKFLWKI